MNFVNYYFSGTSYVRGESLDDLNGLLIYPNHPTHLDRFTFPDIWLTNDLCRQSPFTEDRTAPFIRILSIGLARCCAHL
jgi:hypothetical protein